MPLLAFSDLSTGFAAAPSSAGERIVDAFASLARGLTRLQPGEAAINIGLTVLVVLVAIALVRILDWLLRRGVQRLAARGLVGDAGARGPKMAALTWTLIRGVIAVVAAVLVMETWGLAPLDWMTGRSGAATTRVIVLVLAGAGAVEISGHVLDRMFRGLETRSTNRRAAQFRTLSPIVKGLLQGLLVIFIGLTVLSEMGIKIGPLLAGAGVVGVALGFGAQTLVKDFLTGLFLILEDIVSVGDNVKIGGCGGRVESMTLRTIRLRDFDGTLHVFPYSEAQVIHNRTKSFSNYVFEPRISYVSDVERAIEVMRETGAEMQAAAPYRDLILEPLEIVGVDQFTDFGISLKARFKTLPGDQWRVGREFNRRLKLAFDAEGVEIGNPLVHGDRAELSERRKARSGKSDNGAGVQ